MRIASPSLLRAKALRRRREGDGAYLPVEMRI
jgi:hypothetical protein